MKNNQTKLEKIIPKRSADELERLFDYIINSLKFKPATAPQFLSLERAILHTQHEARKV